MVSIDGVRDKLRVLLVSGEPHAGERTWRNLLKSDASVDLVHFTILRPPEKQDGTPINELSLIAFPTRELFQQKINEFHLIIFDRYARQGVLPIIYFDNIARYVREGGAVLVAAGPGLREPDQHLAHAARADPAGRAERAHRRDAVPRAAHRRRQAPSGDARARRRRYQVRRTGAAGSAWSTPAPPTAPRSWKAPTRSRCWCCRARAKAASALLLSDHIWLWARGYEGGGPHLDLMRRLSHWLMKQPDLEEEALRLIVRGRDLLIERQTMADNVGEVTLTLPSGATRTRHARRPASPGCGAARSARTSSGLWRATDGKLNALVNVGPPNPREFAEVTSTTEVLGPFASATGGDARRLDRCVGQRGAAAHRRDALERHLPRRRLARA